MSACPPCAWHDATTQRNRQLVTRERMGPNLKACRILTASFAFLPRPVSDAHFDSGTGGLALDSGELEIRGRDGGLEFSGP
jgi:hypothetical protein